MYVYFCASFSFRLTSMFTETNVQEYGLSDSTDELC